jgi:hypothetical protein
MEILLWVGIFENGAHDCRGSSVSNQDSGFVNPNIEQLGQLYVVGRASMLNEML